MDFFDYWWIPFIAAGGLGIGAWSLWLEHKRKQKALEVLQEAIARGGDVPPNLVTALAGEKNEDWGMGAGSSPSWPGVAFFSILGVGFAVAAWFADGRQQNAFWLVAGIMAAMAVMTAVVTLSKSRRG